ncbi:Nitronate monooxygenase [Carnimonas sp. R-84981]|uniref:NAD(P)H-dependent flavin oxidoreductase n=1 Tax=Carnimonas bestiolae TaxID=3402172 RepID=UPI003EDC518F
MTLDNTLTQLLGISLPIVQAPMAGGATTPALVAAASNAGALGSLAGSGLSPQTIAERVSSIRALTDRPFAINLFVQPIPSPDPSEVEQAWQRLAPLHEELGITPELPHQWCQPFEEQLETVLELRPAVASFTFGILKPHQIQRLHDAGILVVGNVTHPQEAEAWQALGADAIVAQGAQAGGHRGTFIGRCEDALFDTAELVEACLDVASLPVIAAGGVMDGYGIAALLAIGAQAVQLGTAFLTTTESGICDAWKQALLEASGETQLTRAFSGRFARGLPNRAMRILEKNEASVPAYPIQNALTGALRAAAAQRGDADFLSLWAGKGVARIRPMDAEELIAVLAAELEQASGA